MRPFVMYTGGIDLRKNIEALIRAYAGLPEGLRRQHQLAIICSVQPADRERLQNLAEQAGLGRDDMILTGFVPDEDLPLLYNMCKLFVFPSWHEGFGLPALEAMACGAPVIAANTSSLPEVVGRKDALFDPRNETEISAKIYQALSDQDWSSSLREHGLQQARKFSWDASAKSAIAALEDQHERSQQAFRTTVATRSLTQRKPKLAYFSPLPPERSGIADYSAELLPELSSYYDITVIVDQEQTDEPWLAANFPLRSWQWFDVHAGSFERVVYNFGNSAFHNHMFDMLERHPGVVVLHDFFLSGIVAHLEMTGERPGNWSRALYESHGYAALIHRQQVTNANESIWKFPCNLPVIRRAEGVIVHSDYSMQLARHWYGPAVTENWSRIPHLHRMACGVDKQAARKQLQLNDNDFLLCSFGLLGHPKLNHRLLEAWLASPLAADAQCHLVFVGQNDNGGYGAQLLSLIEGSEHGKRITITGFADAELFRTYLAAADAAVQLRGLSRGETSYAVLDCMTYGLPCIVNENGSMKELPAHALLKLADDFPDEILQQNLVNLRNDAALRKNLGAAAREHIRQYHAPDRIAERYFDAIEGFFEREPSTKLHRTLRKIAGIGAATKPVEPDLVAVAHCLSINARPSFSRQLLLDIGFIAKTTEKMSVSNKATGKTDIRSRLAALVAALAIEPPEGYRLEPVMMTKSGWRYARRLSCELLGLTDVSLDDDVVDTGNGDVYVSIEGLTESSADQVALLNRLANEGVSLRTLDLAGDTAGNAQVSMHSQIAALSSLVSFPDQVLM
ncbi:glycosyltransferase [Undibacterium sp. TJN25]|uniref:glycosyltransferase n=1 Tax=Undibacterium sp. TJN25 TaxID=3413056 RepID=UPI003BF143C6